MEHTFFNDTENLTQEIDEALQLELAGTTWESLVDRLDEALPVDERIGIYQQLRTGGALPDDAGFFLVAWGIEEAARERAEHVYHQQYQTRFKHLTAKYHLDPTLFTGPDDAQMPEEYEALALEFNQAVKAILVAAFTAFGEHKMASLFNAHADEFDRRYDAGFAFFFVIDDDADDEDTFEGMPFSD